MNEKTDMISREHEKITYIIKDATERGILIKTVFSKPRDKAVKKAVLSLFLKDGKKYAMHEIFMGDGKALHEHFEAALVPENTLKILEGYRQADIITSAGNCTVMISKDGTPHISNKISRGGSSPEVKLSEHDRKKTHVLTPDTPFLYPLGISDKDGRVLDRRRSKFKQINRFLELVDDIYSFLPQEGTLTVCDLCCGKSVLAFAVYWYLTEKRGRQVEMFGVDLKSDVIELSAEIAENLGYDGLHFLCGDVSKFDPPSPPCMVLSLHACDTATDLVLSLAVRYKAKVILSTPCCHHEIFHQLSSVPSELSPAYNGRSMLRQKLADSLTDGLRAARLEMEGYSVDTIELVDPDDTPKNILLRAVNKGKISAAKREKMRREYDACCNFFGISPSLDKLIKD